MFGYSWKIRGIVFLGNILIIGIAISLGFLVSSYFQISRILSVVVALLVSFPINQFVVGKYAVKFAEREKKSISANNFNH